MAHSSKQALSAFAAASARVTGMRDGDNAGSQARRVRLAAWYIDNYQRRQDQGANDQVSEGCGPKGGGNEIVELGCV